METYKRGSQKNDSLMDREGNVMHSSGHNIEVLGAPVHNITTHSSSSDSSKAIVQQDSVE